MRWIYVVIISILNFILQSTVLQTIRIFDVSINSSIILVVFLALVSTNRNALTAAFVSGLLQDLFYSWALGVNIFIYLGLAIIIDMIDESVFKDNSKTPLILVASGTVFYHVFYAAFMFILRLPINLPVTGIHLGIEIALNCMTGLLIYKYFIKRILGYELR